MFIFAHNQDLSAEYLKKHPLVRDLKDVKTTGELTAYLKAAKDLKNPLVPRHNLVNKANSTLVEFDSSFYQDVFARGELSKSELDHFRLRLVAFVEVADQDRYSIGLMHQHAARFISVMFTERIFIQDMHDPQFGMNYDVQYLYFNGLKVPSLFNVPS